MDLVPDPEGESAIGDRQRHILAFVRQHGYATIETLAEAFGVSMQTIRRDIIHLDRFKLVQRFHGGAGLHPSSIRLGYAEKSTQDVEAKRRIGELAAALIPEGGSVYLDVGTTVEAVARALPPRRLSLVVTNSMAAARLLTGMPGLTVVVTGGIVCGADGSLAGDAAVRAVTSFRVDVAVIACSGFDSDGTPMDFDLGKTAVKQAAIGACRAAVLVADASKFRKQALTRIAPASDFSRLVTDRRPDASTEPAVAAAGYDLLL